MHYTAISALLKEEFVSSIMHYVDHTIMWLEWGCHVGTKHLITLKMEAASSSETLVLIYKSTWNQSPGNWKSSSALL